MMHYQIDTLVEHNRYLAFFIAFYYITFNCSLNYLYFWHTHTPIHTHTHTHTIIFCGGLHWVFVATHRRSLVTANRSHSSLWCVHFSLQWLLFFAEHRLSSCGTRAWLHRSLWNLPKPGIELVSPALAGKPLSTVPPGKCFPPLLNTIINYHISILLKLFFKIVS